MSLNEQTIITDIMEGYNIMIRNGEIRWYTSRINTDQIHEKAHPLKTKYQLFRKDNSHNKMWIFVIQ